MNELSILDFLSYLRGLGVHLTVQEERLACSAPKGVLDSGLAAELKARKPAIIDFLRSSTHTFSPQASIVTSMRRGQVAASVAQEKTWSSERSGQYSPQPNRAVQLRLRGAVDLHVLNLAFGEIIRRHEVLRTTLTNSGGKPVGVLQDAAGWTVKVRPLPEALVVERDHSWKQAAAEEIEHKFDLARDIPVHCALLVLAPEDHVLIVAIHPVAGDRRSLSLLLAELSQIYNALRQGQPPQLPDLPIQYADYGDWHRRLLESGAFQSQLLYWKEHRRGAVFTSGILPDRQAPAKRNSPVEVDLQRLDARLCEAVARFADARQASLFVVLLTAFKILLFRFSHQADVNVDSVTEGRNRLNLQALLGPFTRPITFRTDLSGNPSSAEVLSRVSETVRQAFAHEGGDPDQLIEVAGPSHETGARDLPSRAGFLLHSYSAVTPELTGLVSDSLEWSANDSGADLMVEACEQGQPALEVAWRYNPDFFDPSSIRRLQESFKLILEQLLDRPELPIEELRLLSLSERTRLLTPAERVVYPDQCIHEWFAEQAAMTPDAVAVRFGAEWLDYHGLEVRTNQLANRLRTLGVGPGALVGVCLPRSLNMLVSVLAVLTAGGAYLPLDPEYPAERLKFMLTDSGAALLITQNSLAHELEPLQLRPFCLDHEEASLASLSPAAPVTGVRPDHLAYVMYTSGSTGNPKGVPITHRSVVNLLAAMKEQIGMGERERLLAVTTLSFDIAGLELYLPLISGAQVILAPREAAWNGNALLELLATSGATIMQATPVTWRLILDAGWVGSPGFKSLSGGEVLPPQLAQRLLATGVEVWNMYGPTETTIWSTLHKLDGRPGPIPLGRPIANTEAYVLDSNREPAPVGVAGELFLGGDGLGEGYLGRPALSAEKFVPHPYRRGAKLFRTGDLVRWSSDNALEYLGRLDQQIKWRGYRIEPGEIEAALEQQPGIRQATVVLHADEHGERRLVAFVTTHQNLPFDEGTLRKSLALRLAGHMVPSAFVRLDELPLTPNRKSDRKALAARPLEVESGAVEAFGGNSMEWAVATIWQELLRRGRIGLSENFFDAGGYSLLLVQLQSRLRRQFGKELSLLELFQNPTVASQAHLLTQAGVPDGVRPLESTAPGLHA